MSISEQGALVTVLIYFGLIVITTSMPPFLSNVICSSLACMPSPHAAGPHALIKCSGALFCHSCPVHSCHAPSYLICLPLVPCASHVPSHLQDLVAEATTRPFCSGGVSLCRGSSTAVARYDHAVAMDNNGGVGVATESGPYGGSRRGGV